ncbi:MAG: hypothetical protein RLZZ543_192 [Bacteroidota bacterium]|jgi:hypothetical protein
MPLRYLIKLLFIGSIALFSACQHSEKSATKTPTLIDLQAEARATLYRYFDAIKEKGLLAEFVYLDSSDDFYWCPPGSTMALDYDSIASVLNSSANRYRTIDNSWEHLRITMIGEHHASYNGILKSHVVDTSGFSSQLRLIETGILIHRTDGWKLLSGQTAVIGTY